MYVVSTLDAACMIDTVSQVSAGDLPLISISVNKNNYTHQKIFKSQKFALSILSKDIDPNIIQTFGMTSSKNNNKFQKFSFSTVENIKVLNDSIGYIYCEVVDIIDADTHTIFIGRVKKEKIYNDKEPMSYNYYQDHKEELMQKVKTANNKIAWICTVCGYIKYIDTLPEDFKCPICGVGVNMFKKINIESGDK